MINMLVVLVLLQAGLQNGGAEAAVGRDGTPATPEPIANLSPTSLSLGSTGVLSGVIHYPDGKPAGGILVTAISKLVLSETALPTISNSRLSAVQQMFRTTSDLDGRYRIENLPPGAYYVAAGFAETATAYPGTSDLTAAQTIITTPMTNLENLDFTIALPLAPSAVRGRVTAMGGAPAAAAEVRLKAESNTILGLAGLRLPSGTYLGPVYVESDGSFGLSGVFPGIYSVEVSYPGIPRVSTTIVVGAQPVHLNLSIAAAVFSGRIFASDGSPLPDAAEFGDVILTTVNDSNFVSSTILAIAADGAFARILEAGAYRLSLRTLPDEYVIRSITALGTDLMNDKLQFAGTQPVSVDIRVARRTASSTSAGTAVRGRVVDSIFGAPALADRVTLCCLKSGFSERVSTPLRPDGTFRFAEVPPGRYTVGLEPGPGQPNLYTVPSIVEVPDLVGRAEPATPELRFASTTQFGLLTATVLFEDGSPLPANSPASVVLIGAGGRVRVIAERGPDGVHFATLPVGDRYVVSMINLPEGYTLKSVAGTTDVQPANNPPIGAPGPDPTPIVITISADR